MKLWQRWVLAIFAIITFGIIIAYWAWFGLAPHYATVMNVNGGVAKVYHNAIGIDSVVLNPYSDLQMGDVVKLNAVSYGADSIDLIVEHSIETGPMIEQDFQALHF